MYCGIFLGTEENYDAKTQNNVIRLLKVMQLI
jgi:hypothetical protein